MTAVFRLDVCEQHSEPLGLARDLFWPKTFESELFNSVAQHKDFADFLARDDVQIPAPADRDMAYGEEHYQYWLMGFSDYLNVLKNAPHLEGKDLNILDLGGSTARVSRHFITARPGSNAMVAEVNVNSVNWINTYFYGNCRGIKVGPYPRIPLPDSSIDLAYGFSVFTHIDDRSEIDWLKELVRVVKPDGCIYLTIASEHTWATVDHEFLRQCVSSDKERDKIYADAVGGPMPAERFSVGNDDLVYNCTTFHSTDYVKRVWSEYASIENIVFGCHSMGKQTAIIMKNDRKFPKP